MLSARGWSAAGEDANHFVDPKLRQLRDPFELADMEVAAERTARAIAAKEKVCIYGDYDVDGVTSTALMAGLLRYLGADPLIVIPHRIRDGYGMNRARVEEIARSGCTLILTVDNGISAAEEIALANELGIDVVVTDHHQARGELPAATALVNPNRPDFHYEHGSLCGVGVAFKFAHALLKTLKHPEAEARRFLMSQMDLVTLGTIADVVPLLGENRVLVRHGLTALAETKRVGLQELIDISGIANKGFHPESVAFGLAPRINAAGRTGDATLALRLLLTKNQREARELAKELDRANRDRREIEAEILEASRSEADAAIGRGESYTLVVSGEGWHIGVVGIVASRLVETYDLPAIVLCEEADFAKGSARSIPEFSIHDALTACDSHLDRWGGHHAAAGLKVALGKLGEFRTAINEFARDEFSRHDMTRTIPVDAEVSAREVDWKLYDDLQRLQPFGEGNPTPRFLMSKVETVGQPRIVGRGHLKLRIKQEGVYFDAIGFSLERLRGVFEAGPADILFHPSENIYQGKGRLEITLEDARPTASA